LHEFASHSQAHRDRLNNHAFLAPLVHPCLAAGKKENLYSGQTFKLTAASAYGFVYVEKGHFVVEKQGKVVAKLTEGDILGLPEFMLGLPLAGYSLQAHGNASEFILTQVLISIRTSRLSLFVVRVFVNVTLRMTYWLINLSTDTGVKRKR
jgi:hypothetical protein